VASFPNGSSWSPFPPEMVPEGGCWFPILVTRLIMPFPFLYYLRTDHTPPGSTGSGEGATALYSSWFHAFFFFSASLGPPRDHPLWKHRECRSVLLPRLPGNPLGVKTPLPVFCSCVDDSPFSKVSAHSLHPQMLKRGADFLEAQSFSLTS